MIGPDGSQLGILDKEQALQKARELELDLVEIATQIDPPVAKILDFQKFKYQENKRQQAARKGSNEGGQKELWLSPRIADHDLGVRLRRTEEFLKDGHQVKLTVKFKGREMGHQELGVKVLEKVLNHFGARIKVIREPKMEGRKMSVIIVKGKVKKERENAKTKNQ